MLESLLPGARDLRVPLASGYLWLFAAYLALAPRLTLDTTSSGVSGDLARVASASGPVAVGVAISFLAYLVGIIWEGLVRPTLRRITKSDLVPIAVAYVDDRRVYSGIDRALMPIRRAVRDRLIQRFERDASARNELAERLDAAEEKLQKDRSAPKGATFAMAGEMLSRAIEEKDVVSYYHIVGDLVAIDAYYDDCARELERVPPRLLGKDPDLWNAWDRIRSEAEFRASLTGPVAALVIVLAFRLDWIWLLGIGLPVVLVALARTKAWKL